jgi:hypothetical protein
MAQPVEWLKTKSYQKTQNKTKRTQPFHLNNPLPFFTEQYLLKQNSLLLMSKYSLTLSLSLLHSFTFFPACPGFSYLI